MRQKWTAELVAKKFPKCPEIDRGEVAALLSDASDCTCGDVVQRQGIYLLAMQLCQIDTRQLTNEYLAALQLKQAGL